MKKLSLFLATALITTGVYAQSNTGLNNGSQTSTGQSVGKVPTSRASQGIHSEGPTEPELMKETTSVNATNSGSSGHSSSKKGKKSGSH